MLPVARVACGTEFRVPAKRQPGRPRLFRGLGECKRGRRAKARTVRQTDAEFRERERENHARYLEAGDHEAAPLLRAEEIPRRSRAPQAGKGVGAPVPAGQKEKVTAGVRGGGTPPPRGCRARGHALASRRRENRFVDPDLRPGSGGC